MNRLLLTIATIVCMSYANFISLEDFVPEHPIADNSTFGNIEQVHTHHLHLHVEVDFDTRKLKGSVTHDFEVLSETRYIVLDAWDISVTSVKSLKNGAARRMETYGTDVEKTESEYNVYPSGAMDYKIDTYNEAIGQTLVIDIGKTA